MVSSAIAAAETIAEAFCVKSEQMVAIGDCLNVPQLPDHAAFDIDLMHQGLRKLRMRFPERVPLGPDDHASDFSSRMLQRTKHVPARLPIRKITGVALSFRRSFHDRQAGQKALP